MALQSVAKVDPLEPVSPRATSVLQVVPTPLNPVAGPTSTGNTSTEGVDMLTYTVIEEGLHLVSVAIASISLSDAATSHFVRPLISVTIPTGNPGVVGIGVVEAQIGGDIMATLIANSNGAIIANAVGLDAKDGAGDNAAVCVPVLAKLGTSIIIKFGHTITGACTDGGTYRIGMSIIKL